MSWLALIVPSPALIAFSPDFIANRFLNKSAYNAPNNMPRYPTFCYFTSFSIDSLTLFVNKQASSKNLTIFMISFISSFKIISVVIPDQETFF